MYLLLSGRRGSNSRPSAWEADALPTELLPQTNFRIDRPPKTSRTECWRRPEFPKRERKNTKSNVGGDGFEPPKAYASRFTVCPIWPLWYPPERTMYDDSRPCILSLFPSLLPPFSLSPLVVPSPLLLLFFPRPPARSP